MDNKHTEDYVLVLEGRTEVQNASEVGKLSIIAEFLNEDGSDSLSETIEANYKRVKQEILSLVESEIERIKNDAKLKHLIKE